MGLLIGNIANSILPDKVKEALNEDVPMYGVKFSSTSTAGTRTYDAATLNWTRSSNSVAGVDDFKNIAPFKTKEVCRVWDGTNATYYYKDDYDDTEWETIRKGTHATIHGDIMIEFKEFWYRRVKTSDGLEIIVSPKYKVGFKPDPWHYVKGVHTENRYIFKYNTDSEYGSLSGKALLVNTNMNTFRTKFQAKGLNILSAQAYHSILLLMLVKYASTDIQKAVGAGRYTSGIISSGGADKVLGVDGSAISIDTNEAPLTMGIENFYGNARKYLDGLFGYNGNLYIKDVEDMITDPARVTDLDTYTKIESTYAIGAAGSIVTAIANDVIYDWLTFPTNSSNSVAIVCNDTWWSTANLSMVTVGGAAWGSAGLFDYTVNVAVGSLTEYYNTIAVC